jgi:hypothetical protein
MPAHIRYERSMSRRPPPAVTGLPARSDGSERATTSHPDRPDVFISYARADEAFVAERLVPALTARGRAVWVDLTDIPPAADWRDRVQRGIAATRAVIAILSPRFVESQMCADEIAEAVRAHKRLVPVLIDDVDAAALGHELSTPNWILLRTDETFEPGIDRIMEALDTDLAWRDQHARLTVRAREWSAAGTDRSHLLRGSDLKAAELWLSNQAAHAERATDEQTGFIIASRHASSRRLRTLLGAVLLALAVATGLAVFALVQRHTAIQRQHVAQSRAFAASAESQLPVDPQLSLLLAARGEHIADTLQARDALRDAVQRSRVQLIIRAPRGQGGENTFATFAPHSTTVATTFGRRVAIWDGRTGRRMAELPHDGYPSFTQDGRFLLSTFNDRRVWVYDTRDWKSLGSLPTDRSVLSVSSSPDGRWVAGIAPGEVLVWDMRTRRLVARLPHPRRVVSAVFDPTSTLVLTAAEDGMRVWRRSSATVMSRFGSVHHDDSPAGHFSRSGGVVVTTGVETPGGARGQVVFWRAGTGRGGGGAPVPVVNSPPSRRASSRSARSRATMAAGWRRRASGRRRG